MAEYNFTLEKTAGSADGSSASILFFQSDRLFNVRGLTDLSGNITHYCLEETGLQYFRARYFDNELSRFISRDPLGFVDGHGLYNGYFAKEYNLDPKGTKLHHGDPCTESEIVQTKTTSMGAK